jgi:hypothetical protein
LRLPAVKLFAIGFAAAVASFAATTPQVTFNKDVLPVLQKNCQSCHRTGEVAPMSLMTYADARPWAKAIKAAVLARKMPPWFADPAYGHFSNDKRLSDADIHTLAAWADDGAVEGLAKDRPAPLKFESGWNIKPDVVVEMPKDFHLKASGTINYQYIRVKTDFPEDMWVKAAEMRPGNPAAVHHMKAWVVPPGSRWMADAIPGEAYEGRETGQNQMNDGNDIIGKFNPGLGAQAFDVDGGSAKFVPKGSDVVFEMHYTAIGQEATDRSKVGFVLARELPARRYFFSAGPTASNLVVPPGDGNAEVVSEVTVGLSDAKLVYAQPHMHLRGKDFELRLIYPTGEMETVLKGQFNFDWQLGYDFAKPIVLPKGTRVIAITHLDNSPNNPFNPDPTQEVRWGPQNWEEMSNIFLGLTFDLNDNPANLFRRSGPSLLPPGKNGPTLSQLTLAGR